jgi:hypothetical protein
MSGDLWVGAVTTLSGVLLGGHAQGLVSALDPRSPGDLLVELSHEMSRVLREFEVAARDELEIGGLERSQIMSSRGSKPTT